MAEDFAVLTTIRIDYQRDTPDPARVFRAMSGLIETFVSLDRDLAHSVAVNIEPVVLLERIESGSLKAVLRTILKSVDDEALHNLDWRPLVGQFLVRGKHALLRRLDEHKTIENKDQLRSLQQEIDIVAHQTNVVNVHLYEPVDPRALLADLEELSESLSSLLPGDKVEYLAAGEETRINSEFHISSDQAEDLLTDEITSQTAELTLKIKRPDYLGSSMWDFYHDGHPFPAKILDIEWLQRFQSRQTDVRPGDSIRALVRSEVKRMEGGAPVATRHYVIRVLDVIQSYPGTQGDLFPPEAA